jgi:hypothetical protein
MMLCFQLTKDVQDLLSGVEAELGSLTGGLTGSSSPLSGVLKRDGVSETFCGFAILPYLQLTIDIQDLLSGVEGELSSLTGGLTGGSSALGGVLKRDGVRFLQRRCFAFSLQQISRIFSAVLKRSLVVSLAVLLAAVQPSAAC